MGRPPKVTDDELIETVRERNGFLITTPEVAEVHDIDRRTASDRLKELEPARVVSEPHGRTKGWRLPNERVEIAADGEKWERGSEEAEAAPQDGFSDGIADPVWETQTVGRVGNTEITVPASMNPERVASTHTMLYAAYSGILGSFLLWLAATTATTTGVMGTATLLSIALGFGTVLFAAVLVSAAAVAQLMLGRPLRTLVGIGSNATEWGGT